MSRPLDIVFMGTPDFAAPPLAALMAGPYRVRAVVTQPDRPVGRGSRAKGRKIAPPPVKRLAVEAGLPVFQPESVKTGDFRDIMAAIAPDLFVVVAFGHLLPGPLLAVPRLGSINIHASLLPAYRGSAPIQWAILNRETQTGVTTMWMDTGMDTGDILMRAACAIGPEDTAGDLHDRLSRMGADLLMKTLEALEKGTLDPTPQDPAAVSYAPPLSKSDGRMDWNRPAAAIAAHARGMDPWPGAFTFHGDQRIRIFRAAVAPVYGAIWNEGGSEGGSKGENPHAGATPGTVIKGYPDEIRVAAADGAVAITEVQGASGKRMAAEDFLRGYPLPPGSRLT